MRPLLALVLCLACERDQPTPPLPDPPRPPGPKPLDLSTPPPITGDEVSIIVRIAISTTALFVNGDHVLALDASTTETAIVAALKKSLPAPTPTSRAIIAADKRVMHGTVMAVMDGIKQAGYERLALESVRP